MKKIKAIQHCFLKVINYFKIECDAYLATPRFIEYLTDISSELMSKTNKTKSLRRKLAELNMLLPSNIYIPLVSDKIRDSIILSIPPKEARVFVTKKRIPYLIAIELFNPLEIAYDPSTGMLSSILMHENPPAPTIDNIKNNDLLKRIEKGIYCTKNEDRSIPEVTIENYKLKHQRNFNLL